VTIEGRVWVVTGASSGIGRRTALDVARLGARVCAVARREDLLDSLVEEMGGGARGHSRMRIDVARREEVRRLTAHVGELYGRCDVLVNNAGVSINRSYGGSEAIDDVVETIATNFLGTVYGTLEFVPLLERASPSHVVNVASSNPRPAHTRAPRNPRPAPRATRAPRNPRRRALVRPWRG
jgi:NAD(P)-dependent dehydrogenase (short-subunit alcohol dehydrogenase family)